MLRIETVIGLHQWFTTKRPGDHLRRGALQLGPTIRIGVPIGVRGCTRRLAGDPYSRFEIPLTKRTMLYVEIADTWS